MSKEDEDEIILSVDGDKVTTLTYVNEAFMKQLIQKAQELGVDPVEVKFIPCG